MEQKELGLQTGTFAFCIQRMHSNMCQNKELDDMIESKWCQHMLLQAHVLRLGMLDSHDPPQFSAGCMAWAAIQPAFWDRPLYAESTSAWCFI